MATAIGLGLTAALAWSYWPGLVKLFEDWQANQDYSSGQLVPLIALFFVWRKRGRLQEIGIHPWWPGLIVLIAAQGLHIFGELFLFGSLVRYSLVITVIGLTLAILGKKVAYELRWVLVFLFLMAPLPNRIHRPVSRELQGQAITGTVAVLNLMAIKTVRYGNVLQLVDEGSQIGVVEACSGLRMLVAFFVVSSTILFLVNAASWVKVILLLSSIPIAVLCNMVRLATTTIVYSYANSLVAEGAFHDFAGVAMMPLAVLLFMGEYVLLSKIPGARQVGATPRHERAKVAAL